MSDPAQNEITVLTFTFAWEGFTLTLPATTDDWDADVLEELENRHGAKALRALLGTKQLDALRDHLKKKTGAAPKVKHYADALEACLREYGFESTGE